jgi:hypothetical protein
MRHRIVEANAHPDYRLDVQFAGGEAVTLDLASFVATGEVTEPFRQDPGLFVSSLRVSGGGSWLAWANEVEIDADALWYRAHPEELEQDYGPEAA